MASTDPNISVPVPQKALGYPLYDLASLSLYTVRASISSANTTGEITLFNCPAGTLVAGLGWKCVNPFIDSQMVDVQIQIGDTGDFTRYGTLGGADLYTSDRAGIWWTWDESTAAFDIAANIVTLGGALQGDLDIFLLYRPNSEAQKLEQRVQYK